MFVFSSSAFRVCPLYQQCQTTLVIDSRCKDSANRLQRHTQTFRSENAIELARIAEVQPDFAVVSTAKIRRILDSCKIFAFFLRFLPSALSLLTSDFVQPSDFRPQTSSLLHLTSYILPQTSDLSPLPSYIIFVSYHLSPQQYWLRFYISGRTRKSSIIRASFVA